MHARLSAEDLIRDWQPCTVGIGGVALCGDNLRQTWAQLHVGDLELYPRNPSVQDAWRCYHRGEFARAVVIGRAAGADGLVPAAFACAAYAGYLEQDESRKRGLFRQVMEWCEQAQTYDRCTPNLLYIHAVAMDGYSQSMSAIETVAQGYGLRIRQQAERCLAFNNGHADAHLLLARWHVQICAHAGQLLAAILYRANREAAIAHYERAIELDFDSPIPYMAYAAGLEAMFANHGIEQVIALITCALGKPGIDAKQRLDQDVGIKRLQALRTAHVGSPLHAALHENRPE